jgi:hypothetical protein
LYICTRLLREYLKVKKNDFLEDKVLYNEQKNISAIKKKEKKQTRF